MASRILKFVISVFFLLGLMVRRAWLRIFTSRVPEPLCMVLYYHSVASEERRAFAGQMDLVRRFTTPIDLDALPAMLAGRTYAAITFDDGFQDSIENCVPELVQRGMHARYFITAGALGKPAGWWPKGTPERERNIATAEVVRKLPREFISIGAHTMTHPYLSRLSEAEAQYELSECRRQLETITNCKVTTFSFPYGDFNGRVVRCCHDAGYERVFTTQHESAPSSKRHYLVGRVKVEPTDWTPEFLVKLWGGYIWLPWAIAVKRRVKQRAFGRAQVQVGSE